MAVDVAVDASVGVSVCGVLPASGDEGSVAVWVGSAKGVETGMLQAVVRRRHPIINIFFMPLLIS